MMRNIMLDSRIFSVRRMVMTVMMVATILSCGGPTVDAYRVGDAVDTDIQYDASSTGTYLPQWGFSNTLDAKMTSTLRSQMPRFGISSTVTFTKDENKHSPGFTLLFEDGLRSLEHVPYKNYKGEHLETIVVTFVYSKSGSGIIHSVWMSDKKYTTHGSTQDPFRVDYVWQEEKPVHLVGGHAVLFLIVFVTSLLFLMQTCVLDEEDDVASMEQRSSMRPKAYGGYSGNKLK